MAFSEEQSNIHVSWLIEDIETFGFLLNIKKSSLVPTQSFQYLGLVWDTIAWQVSIKKEREEKIRNNAQ